MIFEPFFQGSHQRKGAVKGSGLGLSIARDCIRRMQGELYLVDESGQDVCFRIELPSSKKHEIMLTAYPIRLFYLSVWPWVMLEILTYLCTLRFLRAVHVQTDCNNYAYCGRLLE